MPQKKSSKSALKRKSKISKEELNKDETPSEIEPQNQETESVKEIIPEESVTEQISEAVTLDPVTDHYPLIITSWSGHCVEGIKKQIQDSNLWKNKLIKPATRTQIYFRSSSRFWTDSFSRRSDVCWECRVRPNARKRKNSAPNGVDI